MRKLVFKILQLISFNYYFQRTKKNRLFILMFHQVNDKKTNFYPAVPVVVFEKICQFLSKHHVVIHISEIENHFKNSNKPAFIISFDDGHFDIIENATPILAKYQLKYNVNIDTEVLETGLPQDYVKIYDILNQVKDESYFDASFMSSAITINRQQPTITEMEFTNILTSLSTENKRKFVINMENALGKDKTVYSKMISKEALKSLKNKNIEFGSHSHTHTLLTTLSDEKVEFELRHSKEILEEILEEKINIMSYPNGEFNEDIEKKAKEIGYTYFLQTADRINTINEQNIKSNSYFRINQYHQTFEEMLGNIYGVHDFLRKLKN